MRLLNVNTLRFKEFFDHDIPPYGILSHRWTDEEVTYKSFLKGTVADTSGYQKIADFCAFVRERKIFDLASWPGRQRRRKDFHRSARGDRTPVTPVGGDALEWVWIDTVCIDKRNSQEMSEAINSMFDWYAASEECYVYMVDVPPVASTTTIEFWGAFDSSTWFTRGWTLQEMLAPATVIFCDRTWEVFGHLQTHAGSNQYKELAPWSSALRFELNERISQVTGIQPQYLSGVEPIESASIARRLSWAASRDTTRIEDEAYCLLGLFDVNMPLLYGEGRKAFLRLQEEIIKHSHDQSIFAWSDNGPDAERTGILAPEIKCFENCGDIGAGLSYWPLQFPFAITNLGLQLIAPAEKAKTDHIDPDCGLYIVQLSCLGQPDKFGTSVDLAILECNHRSSSHYSCYRHSRSRLNDLRGRSRNLRSIFTIDQRHQVEKYYFYIKLSNHTLSRTGNNWDDCKACRTFEWLIINDVPVASARTLVQFILP